MSILFIYATIPDYRRPVFEALHERLGSSVELMTGRCFFDSTTRMDESLVPPPVVVRNRYLLGRRALWQSGAIGPGLRADVVVLDLNPRILSSWTVAILRRLFGKSTLLWGHAWPRAGREAPTDPVRGLMRRLAHAVIVYTETEREELVKKAPSLRVVAARNALYRKAELGALPPQGRTGFIFVGRLVPEKEPDVLVRAYLDAREQLPKEAGLTLVGDGPLRPSLERLVANADAEESVRFVGHVSDVAALRSLYAGALASVSPGYVGLSLIQSLGFGVPMIIARAPNHAPEIEAAREGYNSLMFEHGSAARLTQTLLKVSAERETWLSRARDIAEDCRSSYSLDLMVDRVVEAIATTRATTRR
jgi:glycosyltransferase involved in cell wall biosynthesis